MAVPLDDYVGTRFRSSQRLDVEAEKGEIRLKTILGQILRIGNFKVSALRRFRSPGIFRLVSRSNQGIGRGHSTVDIAVRDIALQCWIARSKDVVSVEGQVDIRRGNFAESLDGSNVVKLGKRVSRRN